MSAANLAAWNVDRSDFPVGGTAAEKARFLVRYAILAPSSHNSQPWRFMVNDRELLVCADRRRSLPNIDPFDRELIISCGAALFNLRVACAYFSIPIEITILPTRSDPDLLARIQFAESGTLPKELAELLDAIALRATNRGPFIEEDVPGDLVDQLVTAAAAEWTEARAVRALKERERMATYIADADHLQFQDPRFRRELASWIHSSRSDDGMPAFSQGFERLVDAATPIAAMVIRTFDLGDGVAATHERLARGSPLLLALSTSTDSQEAWLASGQALQRVVLVAARAGYASSYLNQPIEIEDLRRRLSAEFHTARFPQLLLRIGRGAAVGHSPRRPLADVLM